MVNPMELGNELGEKRFLMLSHSRNEKNQGRKVALEKRIVRDDRALLELINTW